MRGPSNETLTPFELAERGLFAQAAGGIDALEETSLGLKVLRAELEAHIASPAEARVRAESLLKERLSPKESAACWAVVGHAELKTGQLHHGLRAMDRALEAAAACRNPLLEARIRDRLAFSLLNSVGTEAASVEMPRLRQCALRAGDPTSLVAFHILAGAFNARRGHLPSAFAHLDVGRGLLQKFENEWLRGRLAIIASIASMLQSDYATARQHIDEAYSAARRSGSRELLIPAIGNLALLTLAKQDLRETNELLHELLSEIRKSGSVHIALNVRSTILQVALAEADFPKAKGVDSAASSLVSGAPADSLYKLWYLLDRVRLLYAVGDVEAGLAIATDTLPHIQRTSDIDLWRRMKLIAAEGLGRVGRHLEGAICMLEAVSGPPSCPVETTAEMFRVAGRLVAVEDADAARRHFSQAEQILEGVGNLNGSEEVRRDAKETLGALPDHSPANQAFHQTDQIVTLLQTSTNTPLLARGLLSWAASSNCFQSGALIEIDSAGKKRIADSFGADDNHLDTLHNEGERIQLGVWGQRSYELATAPVTTIKGISALISLQRLAQMATSLARARQMERESVAIWPEEPAEKQLGLVCSSERMKDLLKTTQRVADSNVTVLLTGETGVGKELFAKALHSSSARSQLTFLPFNCSTVPREMIDSQLFGHKRGSFTGATGDSAGVIRSAAGGTLFLDEIGEMGIEAQPKLLRFLESGEILPLGETKPQIVDVRVVAATNANLDQLVAEGRFREDLYYRLNVIRINIPPLRERREEIPALVEHFLERCGNELQKPLLRIADETLEYLVLYRWPGNVRQLANEVRRLVAMAEPGAVIMPAHLSSDIAESRRSLPANRTPRLFDEVVTRIDQPLSAAVEHIERAAIQRALAMTDGHLDEAARILGLSRKGLYLKRQRLNLG
jgi:DNA-binding NtrC family response regulator